MRGRGLKEDVLFVLSLISIKICCDFFDSRGIQKKSLRCSCGLMATLGQKYDLSCCLFCFVFVLFFLFVFLLFDCRLKQKALNVQSGTLVAAIDKGTGSVPALRLIGLFCFSFSSKRLTDGSAPLS
jgi:hypothetical protein